MNAIGKEYAKGKQLTEQINHPDIELSLSTSVWDISIEAGSPSVGLIRDDKAEIIQPRHIILAGGAMERPTPFPGWDLPGVMTVGAAQTLLKNSALIPDKEPVILGTGPLVYLFVHQMLELGVKIKRVIDTGPQRVPFTLWGDLLKTCLTHPEIMLKGNS